MSGAWTAPRAPPPTPRRDELEATAPGAKTDAAELKNGVQRRRAVPGMRAVASPVRGSMSMRCATISSLPVGAPPQRQPIAGIRSSGNQGCCFSSARSAASSSTAAPSSRSERATINGSARSDRPSPQTSYRSLLGSSPRPGSARSLKAACVTASPKMGCRSLRACPKEILDDRPGNRMDLADAAKPSTAISLDNHEAASVPRLASSGSSAALLRSSQSRSVSRSRSKEALHHAKPPPLAVVASSAGPPAMPRSSLGPEGRQLRVPPMQRATLPPRVRNAAQSGGTTGVCAAITRSPLSPFSRTNTPSCGTTPKLQPRGNDVQKLPTRGVSRSASATSIRGLSSGAEGRNGSPRKDSSPRIAARKDPAQLAALTHRLANAARLGDVNAVRSCLHYGAAEGARDVHGWTPLHYAAAEGHVEVCSLILELAAERGGSATVAEAQLPDLSTPLMLATEEAHMSVARLLLAHGARASCKDEGGFTALDRCAAPVQNEFVALLREST